MRTGPANNVWTLERNSRMCFPIPITAHKAPFRSPALHRLRLPRPACLARAIAAAQYLSSLQLVRTAELVARAAERCGYPDRGEELQEVADRLSLADRQKMANAAEMVSSAAAKAGQAADTSGRGPDEFRQACRDLEMAARELSIAVASAEFDPKLRDRSAESCNWIFWRKKEETEQFDGGSLADALLQHKPWPASTSTASGTLDLAPGGHARPSLQDGILLLQENLGEYLGYALFGSLTLLPYLDPEGQVMKKLSANEKWAFHSLFSLWWSIVSLGVPCRHSHDSPLMLQCAFAANRIGMVGITALVIWYSYHLIAPKAPISSYLIMVIACILHVVLWGWDRGWFGGNRE